MHFQAVLSWNPSPSEGVTTIGEYAFYKCAALTEITIPSTVTAIGREAFRYCTSLTKVNGPISAAIGSYAFAGCTSLVSVNGSVGADIGVCAFDDCSVLESIALAEGVTTIGENAFFKCAALKEITIPSTVTAIGNEAFRYCTSLTRVNGTVSAAIDSYAFCGCTKLKSITLAEGVPSIGAYAFNNCTSLLQITIPGTVEIIAYETFYNCDSLTDVVICEGVTGIDDRAFVGCNVLERVTIPASVTVIGQNAFAACPKLNQISFGHLSSDTLVIYLEAFYLNSSEDYKDVPTTVYVPYARDIHATLSGYPWADYGRDVTFKSSGYLPVETITIDSHPAEVEAGLKVEFTASIATGNYEVDKYGNLSWWGDIAGRNAQTVIISDSVERIEDFAFLGGDDITEITIGEGVTYVGKYAFYSCDNLAKVSMGSNVQTIGDYAFRRCESLTQISLGSKVKTIGAYAFYDCDNVTEFVLPEGIETLGEYAFANCDNLEKLNLPDSLKSIGRYCFSIEKEGEVKLQLIDLSGNPTQMKEQELQLTYKIPSVLVKDGGSQNRLYWNLVYTHDDYLADKPDPYEIAWIDDSGVLYARGSGTVTVSCWHEYTGAQGTWTIDVSSGVVIRSEDDRDYVLSGETLQLSAWMMPGGDKVSAYWYLRKQDSDYATIDKETGKLSAKNVTGAHEIEVTAEPHNGGDPATMKLWVLPKTTILDICEGAGIVTGEELHVDMALRPTMQLSVKAQPEGAMDNVKWKSSSEAIATVADGLVTFNKPGTVTITASTTDGSSKSASVTIHVIFQDTAKTLTAKLDISGNVLEAGDTAKLLAYGANPDNALDASLLEFGIPDSQLSIATVDDTGRITAGEKAGPVTVTASLKGDPLGRNVKVKLTVIARQTQKLILRTDAPKPAQVQMLDETGKLTTDPEKAANYVVLLKKTDVEEGNYTFTIRPEAFAKKNVRMELDKDSLKWATSNKKLAEVEVQDDGTALVTVEAGSDGACIISAVTKDAAKVENCLTINVRDFAPRLETEKPTLNTNLKEAAVIGLVDSYGNTIKDVALYEADGTKSTRLIPKYDNGVLTIQTDPAEKPISNGKLQLKLVVTCVDGLPYVFDLNAKVSNSAPTITVKQLDKINLFYTDSEARLTVTAKNAQITDVKLDDTADFNLDYDLQTGAVVLSFSERYQEDHSDKPDTKATLLVYLEGYNQPISKDVTIATASKKPTVQTSVKSSVVNKKVADKSAAFGFVIKGSTELLDLDTAQLVDVTAEFASHRIQDDQVVLTLNGESGGTATVLLQLENWMEPIKLTHKVTVEDKNPTLKFDTGTLKLNSVFTEQTASTAATLSQSNQDIFNITFTCATAGSEKLDVRYDPESGNVVAKVKKADDAPNAGSYVFTATATLADGTDLSGVKLKVTVAATAPKVKANTSTLKLNKVLYDNETAVTDFTLTKGEGYTLVGFEELNDWNHDVVELDFVDGQLTAQLLDSEAADKTHTFKLTPILRDQATGQHAPLPTTVTVKVQVYSSEKIAVSLSAKGKLDAINPNSEIVYTIKKITNASGSVTGVSLEGQDADKFDAVLNEDGTISLRMVENEEYSTKQTYKVKFSFTICGQDVLSSVISFKVTQSTLKFAAPSSVNLYQSQTMPLAVKLQLTSPEGAEIADVALGSKSAQAFLAAMGEDGMDVTISEDGRSAEISFDVQNAASLAYGKSYVLYLDVTAAGNAEGAKPTQVKLTIKVQK